MVIMLYIRYPLSLRNVEDLLFERGIDLCHETVRLWWNRFGPLFAADIRRQRVSRMRGFRHWQWNLDEMYVKLNSEMVYLWRAVDLEGEILESYVTKTREKAAALTFMKKALKRHGRTEKIVTDGLRSYTAAMTELGLAHKQETSRWANNRAENRDCQDFRVRAGGESCAVVTAIILRTRSISRPRLNHFALAADHGNLRPLAKSIPFRSRGSCESDQSHRSSQRLRPSAGSWPQRQDCALRSPV